MPMRLLTPLAFILLATSADAQLVNGSFESDGAFSLEGWEWTCEEPTPVTDTPPGGGAWAARKNMGNPDCSPSYLFQRIPFAQGGEHWTLGGWVRADSVGWDAVPRMGFSSVNNGEFPFQNQIGNPAPYWSYVWVTDTVHASATDTAVVLLQCGTGFMGGGWFDALDLQPADPTGLSEAALHLHTYLDAEEVLYLSAGSPIRSAQVFDAAGRVRSVRPHSAAPGSVAIGTDALGAGLYIVQAITDAGPATARFVKR
jgi:hypothetical protein